MAEESVKNLEQLNKDQLQQKLKSYGISAVLTPGSIPIYRRKLAKLMGINKPEEEESAASSSSSSQPAKQIPSSPTINRQQPPSTQPLFKHPSSIDSPLSFFVVFNEEEEGFVPRLFHDIKLMMKFSKKNAARFKRFSCEADAQDFLTEQIEKPFSVKEAKPIAAPDKCPFKTPMMQDMNVFRRAIELGNLDEVDRLAHSNPLYLITQCDSAVIYKPRAGYTAMHIAAKENKPTVVRKIVEIIANKEYVTSLRPNSNLTDEQIQASINHILDYYFNLPERVQNETALHFASKMGFTDVVEELISYKWCKKDLKNKYNETAYDLAGKKCPDEKAKIQKLLENKFYVPLLRVHDNTVQAKVLQPVTSFDIFSNNGAPTSQISPDNVLESSPVVAAVAGPFTTRNEAYDTYVKWSSPDRRRKQGLNAFPIRSSDLERGEERIGRKLAKESGVKWIEFWDFIGEYTDMSSTDGLDMLEQFLDRRSKRLNNLTTMQQVDDNSTRLCATCVINKQKDEKDGAGDHLISTPVQKCRKCRRIQLWSGGEDVESRQRDRLREKLVEDRKEQLDRLLSDEDGGKDDEPLSPFSTLSSSFMSLSIKSPPVDNAAAREDSAADEPAEGGPNIYAERMNIDGYSTPTSQQNRPIFLSGCFPSKLDRDVSLAIEKELVNSQKYPLIAKWLNTIEKYSQKEQQSWRTPRKSSTSSFASSTRSASRPLQLQFS